MQKAHILVLGPAFAGATACVADIEQGDFTGRGDLLCTVERVLDGDALRCRERDIDGRPIDIQLAGVSARERDGSCSLGHPCPAASAEAAIAELEGLALGQVLTCRSVGATESHVTAFCQRSDGRDLNCAMVASGTAMRWERYWRGHNCTEIPTVDPEPIMGAHQD